MNTGTPNMFKGPFDCEFLNENEDIYLLHLMEDHGFERNSHVQQKELCNECEFTCETKANLEKHTSEVHHKDCVVSRHAEGTDKSKTSVEVEGCFSVLSLVTFQMKRKTFSLYI